MYNLSMPHDEVLAVDSVRDDNSLTKPELLRHLVAGSIERVRWNRNYHRTRASRIRLWTLFLSTLVTVLLGVNLTVAATVLKQIAFVCGAAVTLLNALEPFFNYRALWVEHEEALAELYALNNDLRFYLAGRDLADVDENALAEFSARHNEIWHRLSVAWIGHRRGGSNDQISGSSSATLSSDRS